MTRAQQTLALAAFWAATCVLMTLLNLSALRTLKFPDPDDAMRLLQVRDWLAGQSWFDVTQYRLNPPAGVPMHWSRLVDVPIAGVIELCRLFVGMHSAEAAALILVPALTLGIAMLLVYRIGLRLMSDGAALAAAAATPLSLGALKQMRPLRIDHHGWQIVFVLLAVLAALDERPRRSGIVAGIAMATTLNISIEGLPFAAAVGALFAWQWLTDASAGERLRSYLGSLAIVSVLLFALTHMPAAWFNQQRDVLTSANLAAFAAAGVVAGFAVRSTVESFQSRLLIVGCIGVGALATMFVGDPHWLQGPFGSLDPLVRRMWFEEVDEGLPVWRLDWFHSGIGLAQPLVGLIGGAVALKRGDQREQARWIIYLFFLGAVTVESIFVFRVMTTASVVAIPGTACLCELAFRRARTLSLMPVRVIATVGAVFVMTPAYAVPVMIVPISNNAQSASDNFDYCVSRTEIEPLNLLPPGQIAAPLDITPAILVSTRHTAIASGHHRNVTGMRDMIRLFMLPPAQGAEIVARRHADYLVFCPHSAEPIHYSKAAPHGLSAMLEAGRAPDWLEPVRLPGSPHLRVWRVRQGGSSRIPTKRN